MNGHYQSSEISYDHLNKLIEKLEVNFVITSTQSFLFQKLV